MSGWPIEEEEKVWRIVKETWRLAQWRETGPISRNHEVFEKLNEGCDIVSEMSKIDGKWKCSADQDLEVKAAHLAHLQSKSVGFQAQDLTDLDTKYVADKETKVAPLEIAKQRLVEKNEKQIDEEKNAEINIKVGALDDTIRELQVQKDNAQNNIEIEFNSRRQV